MNIVDRLMQVDDNAVNQKHVEVFRSHRLARILGESEPVEIQIRELPYRRVQELTSMMIDQKGRPKLEKKVDTELMLALEAIVNIDFRNKELQDKFGCHTPKELCEKLLQSEVASIAELISDMSGYNQDEEEEKEELEEIKNS